MKDLTSNMQTQVTTNTPTPMPPQLRDLFLRRKINLSQKSWNHINDKWNDEIYLSRKGDPFKKYRGFSNLDSMIISDKVITVSPPPSPSSKPEDETLINKLENEILDLKIKVIALAMVNLGLVIFHTIF
jgi:hypothetical protein